MSDNEFERVFGRGAAERPRFAEKLAPAKRDHIVINPRQAMAVEAASVAALPGEYRAFGFLPSGHINPSCEVRWWLEGTTIPEGLAFPYRFLIQVGFTGDDTLRLMLPDTVIQITGTHLEPLRLALMHQQVTFIQQFSSRVWAAKPNGEPVIDRIEKA